MTRLSQETLKIRYPKRGNDTPRFEREKFGEEGGIRTHELLRDDLYSFQSLDSKTGLDKKSVISEI